MIAGRAVRRLHQHHRPDLADHADVPGGSALPRAASPVAEPAVSQPRQGACAPDRSDCRPTRRTTPPAADSYFAAVGKLWRSARQTAVRRVRHRHLAHAERPVLSPAPARGAAGAPVAAGEICLLINPLSFRDARTAAWQARAARWREAAGLEVVVTGDPQQILALLRRLHERHASQLFGAGGRRHRAAHRAVPGAAAAGRMESGPAAAAAAAAPMSCRATHAAEIPHCRRCAPHCRRCAKDARCAGNADHCCASNRRAAAAPWLRAGRRGR